MDLIPNGSALAGKDLNVFVAATPKRAVTGGKVTLVAKYMGVQLTEFSMDVCDVFQCPLPASVETVGVVTGSIPALAFSGVTVSVELSVQDGATKLSCLKTSIKIGKPGDVKKGPAKGRGLMQGVDIGAAGHHQRTLGGKPVKCVF